MMNYRQNSLFLLVCMFFGYASSDCYGCNGSGEYCCGYDVCCYSIYAAWWFWVIIVAVFLLKVSCIGCYVRARRRRAAMLYVQAPLPTSYAPPPPPGHVLPQNQGQQYPHAPPAYPGQQPPKYNPGQQPPRYNPGQPGYMQQGHSGDATVNKDTELLVG